MKIGYFLFGIAEFPETISSVELGRIDKFMLLKAKFGREITSPNFTSKF